MERAKQLYVTIKNGFVMMLWSWRNPRPLQPSNFKMLSDLFALIMKVATENRHMMTHIAYIHPDEGEKQIVSIWAGAGHGSDPVKRISELVAENSRLKAELSKALSETPNSSNPN